MARRCPHHSAFAHGPPLDNSVKSTWECFLCAVGHSKVRGSHEKFCILVNVHFLCHLCFLCCKCLDWGFSHQPCLKSTGAVWTIPSSIRWGTLWNFGETMDFLWRGNTNQSNLMSTSRRPENSSFLMGCFGCEKPKLPQRIHPNPYHLMAPGWSWKGQAKRCPGWKMVMNGSVINGKIAGILVQTTRKVLWILGKSVIPVKTWWNITSILQQCECLFGLEKTSLSLSLFFCRVCPQTSQHLWIPNYTTSFCRFETQGCDEFSLKMTWVARPHVPRL